VGEGGKRRDLRTLTSNGRFFSQGASKNLALLVFRVPDFIFWLKEGVLSMSDMLFFATPSFITKFYVSLSYPLGF
jgi:hypothetical protein